jgi:hypothetical protein
MVDGSWLVACWGVRVVARLTGLGLKCALRHILWVVIPQQSSRSLIPRTWCRDVWDFKIPFLLLGHSKTGGNADLNWVI